jgi:FAD/FMN-containing dehydrogenase
MVQSAALRHQLSASGCIIHDAGSREYARATRLWNGAVERKPALVAACSVTNDVRTASLAAQATGLPVSLRNGGQDRVGRALQSGGLVLDLAPMRHCSVNVEQLK